MCKTVPIQRARDNQNPKSYRRPEKWGKLSDVGEKSLHERREICFKDHIFFLKSRISTHRNSSLSRRLQLSFKS